MRTVLTGLSVLALAGTAAAETLKVPQQYATIAEAAAAANEGDTIVVSKGVYFENVTFNQPSLRIVGKKAVIDGAPGTSHGTAFTVDGGGTTIQGFTFRNGSTQLQINGSDCVVSKCRFDGPRGTGINAGGASNTTVTDCVVLGPGSTGILLGSGSVSRSSVRQGSAAGIVLFGPGASVDRCTVLLNSSGRAIEVTASPATVTGNRVAGCAQGIRVNGDGAQVTGNSISRVGGGVGVQVFGSGALVSANAIVDAAGGVEVFGDSADILGNRVSGFNGEYYGIYVAGDDPAIGGNQVAHGYDSAVGIRAQSGSVAGGGFVDDNRVQDVDVGGIEISGTGIAVRRNRVAGCGNSRQRSGFRLDGTGHTIEDCSSDGNRDSGFVVSGSGHALRRCRAKGNTAFGFVLFGDDHAVDACVATGHGGAGLINLGMNLLLLDSTFLGNREDVSINPFGPATFSVASSGNTFVTGGLAEPSDIWQADD